MHENPYASALGDRDPLQALAETPERIRQLVQAWPADRLERSYAPGKWSARQVIIHLAQTEMALPTRARFALAQAGYAAQSFDQDDWAPLDASLDAKTALDAYLAMRKMNVAMFRAADCGRTFTHPEYGELTVGWVAAQMAGHDLHHLKQLEQIR